MRKNRGSVLIEYLLLCGASILTATAALAALQQAHQQMLDQIQSILLGR